MTHQIGDYVVVSRTLYKMGVGTRRGWQTMPRAGVEGVIIGTRTVSNVNAGRVADSSAEMTAHLVSCDRGRKTVLALPADMTAARNPCDPEDACGRCSRPVMRRWSTDARPPRPDVRLR
ncbi:hypothetical protein [Mycetocola sp.]|uniref:hypothetical protein n=1 Tax=Mycetocola sp. TaxID=1871042 RepID=UPI00398A40B7